MKTIKPAYRPADCVRLASHVRCIPAYGDKPIVTHATELRVSSLSGNGSKRQPWSVTVTDGQHFWHVDPSDLQVAL